MSDGQAAGSGVKWVDLSAVTVHASGTISAHGDERNRSLVEADVRRLLGDECPAGPLNPSAVANLEGSGVPDAVARLGGPFARFIEFVTPEEAAITLGRVIVGAPAEGRGPFGVRATFRLHGEDGVTQQTVARSDLMALS